MSIQDAYTQWSPTYDSDRNLTRDLDRQVTEQILGLLRCRTILEIGCGTGKNTSLLAGLGRQVLALDFSVGMLHRARRKLQADNLTFVLADLTHPWPCREQSIDLIACNLVLEHIRDLDFIFRQAAHTLANHGRFLICELHPFRQYQGKQAGFEGRRGTIKIPAFVHPLSDFLTAAESHRMVLLDRKDWWHAEDQGQPPRLVSFLFERRGPR
ncbi:MAG: class I SAM-dependent methyltransferase [Anaerolineales bacterium]|nr:class I SAM-dependent methyltransferase [Anaerolineales bacterium]